MHDTLWKSTDRRWTQTFSLGFWLGIFLILPSFTIAAELDRLVLNTKDEQQLLAVSSEQQAIRFYQQVFGLPAQSIDRRIRRHSLPSSSLLSPETHTKIIALVGNLLGTTIASMIQTHMQHHDINNLTQLDGHGQTTEWMLSQSTLPSSARDMMTFHSHLRSYFSEVLTISQRPKAFDTFATYVDHRYPILTASQDSWVHLLAQGELEKMSERLTEFWDSPASQNQFHDQTSNQESRQKLSNRYAHYYSLTRLWPIFRAHLLSLTIQAKAEALLSARQTLRTMQEEHEADTLVRARARLCGKWQWTVHNHQNHGDHKLIMYFGEPKDFPVSQPQPTDIHVHGNTVYLLWKFPQGFQEDSLLFSNNDGRLEGTFRNTFGPYGSITGKRLSSCKQ